MVIGKDDMGAIEKIQTRIQELKKRVQEKRKATANFKADPDFRKIRKKLKRLQRKRRSFLPRVKPIQATRDKKEKKTVVAPGEKESVTESKG